MTKRLRRKYALLNFYHQDLFGELVSKDRTSKHPNKNFKREVYLFHRQVEYQRKNKIKKKIQFPQPVIQTVESFKQIKINRKLIDEKLEYAKKKAYFRKHGRREGFYYRVDIGKPRKKRRKITNFMVRLLLRHKIRFFFSSMSVRQYRSYLKITPNYNKLFYMFTKFLESRLDFFLRRINFIVYARHSRQLVNHCNFAINGIVCNKSSIQLNLFDIVSPIDKDVFWFRTFYLMIKGFKFIFANIPSFIEINFRIMSAMLIYIPNTKKIPLFPYINTKHAITTGKRFKS